MNWKILKGLPGDGPAPIHFHCGRPTPWKEGFVIKFYCDDESVWVGNFQPGMVDCNAVVEWPEGKLVVVVVTGACYFVPPRDPNSYGTHNFNTVHSLLFDSNRELLFVADYCDVTAYRTDRTIAWRQEAVGISGISLTSCIEGVLDVEVEFEMGEPWSSVKLAVSDGQILEER